ncbi:metal-dependent hydrolase [Fibrella forsythiae]|uniref:Metal-dependent hydrolase n=1 Tax=Fibrella forsythiae TaxID=2817061 RepID=A0ABS3JLJ3_9BACT|nr:metal-dependent hydrolase [Fibrella forsythiae]MBO0950875.1 metal-dependent hydrolase [Fibrella forsythiae]
MQGYNHVAGGIVFSGIFASFHDVNVFAQPSLIGATVFCALLPDVDHVSSTIGKVFYPLATYLQSRYGHRTITHSIFCYALFCCLIWLLPHGYFVCCFYAFGSHLLFDMCTRSGVPLLYPFSRRPFVLPANPGMRLSSTDHRGELVVLAIFILIGSFCQPLMAKGFWTTYNEAFATWEHVDRESKRSRDLLQVTWSDQQKQTHSGYFYRSAGTTNVVLTAAGFELPKSTETRLISFSHSGITASEHTHTLTNVPLDSLNRLLAHHCLTIQIQSLDDITYFDGPLLKVGKVIDLQHRKNLLLSQPQHDDSEALAKIELLTIEREATRRRYAQEMQTYRRALHQATMHHMHLQALAAEFGTASDYRKGQIIMERKRLETQIASDEENPPLPPIAPDMARFDLQEQLLRRLLIHDSRISANVITVSTSKPLPAQ